MAWNEPGDNKNRDPWNNNGKRGGNNNGGPPDLDELFKKLNDSLKSMFGGKGSNNSGDSSSGGGSLPLLFIAVIALLAWAFSGIYIVDQSERGVVLKFGEYQKTTMPGPHWYARFIQSVQKVNVLTNRQVYDEGTMLTEDENIADIKFSVQYVIKDPAAFLFNLRDDSESTVVQASRSAIREVIGKNKLDYVITDGRDAIADRAGSLLQEILDNYKSGIDINLFNLTYAAAPQQVQGAFDDAIKAREDKERFINEAQAYSNEIIPLARGEAKRQVEEAKAYEVSVVKRSEGEADRFDKLLVEYQKAPKVTRERLYLDAVESVLSNSTKVMMDVDSGNNIMYLPLDQIIQKPSSNVQRSANSTSDSTSQGSDQQFSTNRNTLRTRESR